MSEFLDEFFHDVSKVNNTEAYKLFAGTILCDYLAAYANNDALLPKPRSITDVEPENDHFGYHLAFSEPFSESEGHFLTTILFYSVVDREKRERTTHHDPLYSQSLRALSHEAPEIEPEDVIAGWRDSDDIDLDDWRMIATFFHKITSGKPMHEDKVTRFAIAEGGLDFMAAAQRYTDAIEKIIKINASPEEYPAAFHGFLGQLFTRHGVKQGKLALRSKTPDEDPFSYFVIEPQSTAGSDKDTYSLVVGSLGQDAQVEASSFRCTPDSFDTEGVEAEDFARIIPNLTISLMLAEAVDYASLPPDVRLADAVD